LYPWFNPETKPLTMAVGEFSTLSHIQPAKKVRHHLGIKFQSLQATRYAGGNVVDSHFPLFVWAFTKRNPELPVFCYEGSTSLIRKQLPGDRDNELRFFVGGQAIRKHALKN
jgi:hypothetical protein